VKHLDKVAIWIGRLVPIVALLTTILGVAATLYVDNAPDPAALPFRITDIKDSQSLLVKLKQARDPLSTWLRASSSTAFQQHLTAYDGVTSPPSVLVAEVVRELNDLVLKNKSLYDINVFGQVRLSNETRKLVDQTLQGDDLILLNRSLITEGYPEVTSSLLDAFLRKANSKIGGFNAVFIFALTIFSFLFTTVYKEVLNAKNNIEGLVRGNSQQLEKAAVFGTIASLYPPLAMDGSLESIFREHKGGMGNNSHGKFTISHSKGHHHITVHSEVLYYSLFCSLMDSFKGKISELQRSHVFLPNSPSALFLPEIIKITKPVTSQHRYYFFRNNVLDYNRDLLRGTKADKNHVSLLSTFAKASRILFSDDGANFGFLEAVGDKTIWDDRDSQFKMDYALCCERFSCRLKDTNTLVSGYVKRDADTLQFSEAFIMVGEDTDTKRFFEQLQSTGDNNRWRTASNWGDYPLEVALVSGEEMEHHSQNGVHLWAVDDYKISGFGGGWLEPGDPRNIAWLKSVAAALRETVVHRLFFVPKPLFATDSTPPEKQQDELVELFKTMALQFHFLSQKKSNGEPYGKVRLLLKEDNLLENPLYKKWTHTGAFPDYSILVRSTGGQNKIVGGVALHPEARYVKPDDQEWLAYLKELWDKALEFPECFSQFGEVIFQKRTTIVSELSGRNELLNQKEKKEHLQTRMEKWLDELYKPKPPNGPATA
jgi:hypothetical protein